VVFPYRGARKGRRTARSLSAFIVPVKRGNQPERPCGGKGEHRVIELLTMKHRR
jgi:hypothetical protein